MHDEKCNGYECLYGCTHICACLLIFKKITIGWGKKISGDIY